MLTALRLDPTDKGVLAGAASLGAGLTEAGRLDDTLRMLDEVRRVVGPAYEPEYHNLCGNAYLAMDRYDEALADSPAPSNSTPTTARCSRTGGRPTG